MPPLFTVGLCKAGGVTYIDIANMGSSSSVMVTVTMGGITTTAEYDSPLSIPTPVTGVAGDVWVVTVADPSGFPFSQQTGSMV